MPGRRVAGGAERRSAGGVMTIWLTARAAGLGALILLSLTTACGAIAGSLAARRSEVRRPEIRVVLGYVHRVAASLGLSLLFLHVVMILCDSYAHVGFLAALVPFTSYYRPLWVGLGSLAVYCFLFVAATGIARRRFAESARAVRRWRILHAGAYAGWALAIGHGFFAGSDSDVGWVQAIYIACAAGVAGPLSVRIAMAVSSRSRSARSLRVAPARSSDGQAHQRHVTSELLSANMNGGSR